MVQCQIVLIHHKISVCTIRYPLAPRNEFHQTINILEFPPNTIEVPEIIKRAITHTYVDQGHSYFACILSIEFPRLKSNFWYIVMWMVLKILSLEFWCVNKGNSYTKFQSSITLFLMNKIIWNLQAKVNYSILWLNIYKNDLNYWVMNFFVKKLNFLQIQWNYQKL